MKKKVFSLLLMTIGVMLYGQSWTEKTAMPTPRTSSGAAVVGDTIFVIGGNYGNNILGTVEAYCESTDTWTTKTAMPTPRTQLGVAVVNGIIYAIGGWNGSSATNVVEAFNPATNTWTSKKSLPIARSLISCGAIGNDIYVCGGYPNESDSMEIYNVTVNTWTNYENNFMGEEGINSCVVMGAELFLMGGTNSNETLFYNTTDAYDTTFHSWVSYLPMPEEIYDGAAALLNNKVHYFGGANGTNDQPNFNYHFVLTISNYNYWSTGLALLHKRSGEVAQTVNGKIYVIGGIDSIGNVVGWNEVYDTVFTGVNNIPNSKVEIIEYPNPNKGKFEIQINGQLSISPKDMAIAVYNMFGEEINPKLSIVNSTLLFDLSSQPAGIYFYKVTTLNESLIGQGKLIIQK